MSTPPESAIEYRNSIVSVLKTMMWSGGLTIICAGAALGVVAIGDDLSTGKRWIGAIIFGLVTLIPLGIFVSSFAMLTPDGRVAVGISDQGLRVMNVDLIPWDDVEVIYLHCWRYPGGASSATMQALRVGVNHVHLIRKSGDPATPSGPEAKHHYFAYEDELKGGRNRYLELGRELLAKGKAKGVPVYLQESGRPWIHEPLGYPPVAPLTQ